MKKKHLFVFEGYNGGGKSTLINMLIPKFAAYWPVEVIDKTHPPQFAVLFNQKPSPENPVSQHLKFCFRWTRLALQLHYMLQSPNEVFFVDRGLLTAYIYSRLHQFEHLFIRENLEGILTLLELFNYNTVFIRTTKESANMGLLKRQTGYESYKKGLNDLFEPYLQRVEEYDFLGNLILLDRTEKKVEDAEELFQKMTLNIQRNRPPKFLHL